MLPRACGRLAARGRGRAGGRQRVTLNPATPTVVVAPRAHAAALGAVSTDHRRFASGDAHGSDVASVLASVMEMATSDVIMCILTAGVVVVGVKQVTVSGAQTDISATQADIMKEQTAIARRQLDIIDNQETRATKHEDEKDAVRRRQVADVKAQVHERAARAVVAANHAHFEAVRTNSRVAAEFARQAMADMEAAYRLANVAPFDDEPRVSLDDVLHKALQGKSLAGLRAVMLYYAASSALHTLDEQLVTVLGRPASDKELRFCTRTHVHRATKWLVRAEAILCDDPTGRVDGLDAELHHRIDLRLADARSIRHAVLGDPRAATQVYAERVREASLVPSGSSYPVARFHSNYAMALFGRNEHECDTLAVNQLELANECLSTIDAAPTATEAAIEAAAALDAGHEASAASYDQFGPAIAQYTAQRRGDRERILRRKRVTVPAALVFVRSLVDVDATEGSAGVDAAAELDVLVERTRAFARESLDREDKGEPDPLVDVEWLRTRGMVRVLAAVFVALERLPAEIADEASALADEVIAVAAELAKIRAEPGRGVVARGGDFGAFVCAVAQDRPGVCEHLFSGERHPVSFSLLARARRMQSEAEAMAGPNERSKRHGKGSKLNTERLERIRALLAVAMELL